MSSNKYKVLVVQGLHEQGLEMLKNRTDIEFNVLMSDDENKILEAAKDVNGITVRTAKISSKIIEAANKLQVVSRHGVGYDSIDLVSLNNKKIPLTIAAHSNMISVSEQAMFFLLALSKNVFYYDDFTRKGDWTNRWDVKAWDLAKKNILVEKEKVKISGAIPVDNISENLPKMDAVTLHCPKNDETTDLFTKQEFDLMKKSSFIINCARGGILNEEDLYEALTSKKIAGAGLDVFDVEPTPSSNPLFKLNNVILSPHIAGVTVESTVRMATETVQNVLDVLDDKINQSVVVNNKEIGM